LTFHNFFSITAQIKTSFRQHSALARTWGLRRTSRGDNIRVQREVNRRLQSIWPHAAELRILAAALWSRRGQVARRNHWQRHL